MSLSPGSKPRHDYSPLPPGLDRSAAREGRSLAPIPWSSVVRTLEMLRRRGELALPRSAASPTPPDFIVRATRASFAMDGIEVDLETVRDALQARQRAIRSRQAQRLRNHAAILRRIEWELRYPLTLTAPAVVRWYTAISSGLSSAALDRAATMRMDEILHQVNRPQPRTAAAIQEIAATYALLLSEPLVPSFNGILARLLLRYHLGRCKLPGVIMEPTLDVGLRTPEQLTRRLIVLVEQSYTEML